MNKVFVCQFLYSLLTSSLFFHVQPDLSVGLTLLFHPTFSACYTECNFSNPAVLFNQTPPVRF
jgi:hypothetical protein